MPADRGEFDAFLSDEELTERTAPTTHDDPEDLGKPGAIPPPPAAPTAPAPSPAPQATQAPAPSAFLDDGRREQPAAPTAADPAATPAAPDPAPATLDNRQTVAPATATGFSDFGMDSEPPMPYVSPAVADYEGKLDAINAKLAAAREKYAAGDADIDDKALARIEAQTSREIATLAAQQQQHERDTAAAQDAEARVWDSLLTRMNRALASAGGAALTLEQTQTLTAYLSAETQLRTQLGQTDLTRAQLLANAYQRMAQDHNLTQLPAPNTAQTPPLTPAQRAIEARKPPPAPTTLAHVPSGNNIPAETAITGIDSDFARLDALYAADPAAGEAELLRWSPAKQKAWLEAE